MSLLVIWKGEDFAAVARDGLVLERKKGGFVRASEDVPKFWMIDYNSTGHELPDHAH